MNFEETNTQDKGGVMQIINIHKETLLNNKDVLKVTTNTTITTEHLHIIFINFCNNSIILSGSV